MLKWTAFLTNEEKQKLKKAIELGLDKVKVQMPEGAANKLTEAMKNIAHLPKEYGELLIKGILANLKRGKGGSNRYFAQLAKKLGVSVKEIPNKLKDVQVEKPESKDHVLALAKKAPASIAFSLARIFNPAFSEPLALEVEDSLDLQRLVNAIVLGGKLEIEKPVSTPTLHDLKQKPVSITTPYDLKKLEDNLLGTGASSDEEVVYIKKKLNKEAKNLVEKLSKQAGRLPEDVLADQLELLDEIEIYVRRPKTFLGSLKDLLHRSTLLGDASQYLAGKPSPDTRSKYRSKLKALVKKVLKSGSIILGAAALGVLGGMLVPSWRERILRKLFGLTSKALLSILKRLKDPKQVVTILLQQLSVFIPKLSSGSQTGVKTQVKVRL